MVKYAQQWVSHIQAADNAPEGKVEAIKAGWKLDIFVPGDLIVCRKAAPLLNLAYRFLRERRPATILGREIGQGLAMLIRKMNAPDIDALQVALFAYEEREVEKAQAKGDEAKVEALLDKVGAIRVLADSLEETNRTVQGLLQTLDQLFSNKAGAVLLATIHKSKGLEADNVYWLGRDECPAKWARQDWQRQQEVNLCYVATTRAKKALYTFSLGE